MPEQKICKKGYELKVLSGNLAGYYIGTMDEEGSYCRLSEGYYKSRDVAQQALDTDTFTVRSAVEIAFCSGGDCGLTGMSVMG